ncbi:MAG: fasciclin domain-containing protein [Chitinophagaceae bacterium]
MRNKLSILFLVIALSACQKQVQKSEEIDSQLTIGAMLNNASATDQNTLTTEIPGSSNGSGPSNPLAFARSQERFSVLTVALAKTGLLNTLMRLDADYTLFAPSDAAFAAANINVATVTKLPEETLKQILLYHVVAGKVPAAAVTKALDPATLNGKRIFVRPLSGTVAINLSKVTIADVMAKNGVIHVIDKVLLPPTKSIVDVVVSDTSFSLLKTAVLKAKLETALSGAGPFTVFAPLNSAFRATPFNTEAAINGANVDALTGILTYHVISGAVFSIDLSNGLTPTMLSGKTTIIGLGTVATIKGSGNNSPSTILATDILTTNGVIHVIDQVLLP